MTKVEFESYWSLHYPGAKPIPHSFGQYADRWFRIHSLPGSKRYPEIDKEWSILLSRQNEMITDILGNKSRIIVVTGDFFKEGENEMFPLEDVMSIKRFPLQHLEHIDLHAWDPAFYDEGHVYRPVFFEATWSPHEFDDILKDMALDKLRAFILSTENTCIANPYDGGVDFILNDTKSRDQYKLKYTDWLSGRADGL